MTEQNKPQHTRHLIEAPATATAPTMPSRVTGPLDEINPWVFEFRVVGTSSIIKARVKDEMLIGRPDPETGKEPEIDLTDYGGYEKGVSRKHALLRTINNRVSIEDLNSANHTYINGHILEAGKQHRIRNQDIIRLGQLQLQLHFLVKPHSDETTGIHLKAALQIPKIGKGKRVLVIDDDQEVCTMISTVLQYSDFEVLKAHSGSDAIVMIDEHKPDAIVMELVLPDMSGLDIVRYVRNKVGMSDIPMMAVTTATAGYQMGQAESQGIGIVLGKPVAVDELVKGIGQLVTEKSL